jgi:PAS domain S-box-containing protein
MKRTEGARTDIPERSVADVHAASRRVAKASLSDSARVSPRELDALFDQSPAGLLFTDRELRVTRTNTALCRLVGLPDEALIGRRPSEIDSGVDGALIERVLAGQVLDQGVPVVNVPMEQTVAGERRALSWSAYLVTDNGLVLGVLYYVTDVTDRMQALTVLRQAHDLLERAGYQIGTTLDIYRTAAELADLAVPGLADIIRIDLLDQVLEGETPGQDPPAGSGSPRFRRVAVRDAAAEATVSVGVGDLITAPRAYLAASALRGKPLLARNWGEMTRQVPITPSQAEFFRSRGLHTLMLVPLAARGVTLGVAVFCRAENPSPTTRPICGWPVTSPRGRRCASTTPGCTPASTPRR